MTEGMVFTGALTFDDFKHQNGFVYWWASDLMNMLGYKDMEKFQKVIDRATKAFISLNINHYDNIVAVNRDDNKRDFKLTRFACYLIAMNGDPKKPDVAKAQAYFIEQARQFELLVMAQNQVERIATREELKEAYTSLNSTAKFAGLDSDSMAYAKFTNQGYLGMYNRMNWQLAQERGIDKSELLEYMGKTELAANTLRAAMTEERIKNEGIYGQRALEQAHNKVGAIVRQTVKDATGKYPEDLPQEPKLPGVKKELKDFNKEMKKIDDDKKELPKKRRRKKE